MAIMKKGEVPAYYHMGVSLNDAVSLDIHMHPDSLEAISTNRVVSSRQQNHYEFSSEFETSEKSWGFDGVANIVDSQLVEGWKAVKYKIPNLASVKSDWYTPSHEELLPLSVSISVPLLVLNSAINEKHKRDIPAGITHSNDSLQHMLVKLNTDKTAGYSASTFSASILSPLVEWLSDNISPELEEGISESMYLVDSQLTQSRTNKESIFAKFGYRARLKSAQDIHFDVAGADATGLDSAYRNSWVQDERAITNEAYDLVGHNIDRIHQQLALLAGLAYMNQKAIG